MRDPEQELIDLETAGLKRSLTPLKSPQGVRIQVSEKQPLLLNFSSNDYLGLAHNEEITEHYNEHLRTWGGGSGASRLVCGTQSPHLALEEKIAKLKQTEAALTFSSGFATAIGTISALCGKDDVVIADKLCHASLIDGARLSGATLRVYPHNHLNKLLQHLDWAINHVADDGRILVVTESVFSMDGDRAPLREICKIVAPSPALLLVDEAHAFGILGPSGRGLAAELGLESEIDFQMGTFSKAVGLSGGYVCCRRAFADLLVNRARSFIYSTAPAPALAATVVDALDLIASETGDRLRDTLWQNLKAFSENAESAIVPLIIGEYKPALDLTESLREKGFLIPAIRYPTVPRGTARLRITFSAAHESADIAALKAVLAEHSTPVAQTTSNQ
ncbi:MAG: 8-amino-7-oxononanoate synthase [Verrucomicrobiota bacterium]